MWPIGIPLIDAPTKIAMPHTMICFHIHASKFLETQATQLYLHHFQLSKYDQSLQPLLRHSYTNFFINWIILWTKKL